MSKCALGVAVVTASILIFSAAGAHAQEIGPVELEHAATTPPPRLSAPLRASSLTLGSLYVSTAVLYGLDVHSTLSGLHNGAVEANPMMQGLVTHPAALVGVKAGLGFGSMMAARSIAKKNRTAAIVALAAIDAIYVIVVHHNYQVARQLR
jgi:hypothetical protein